MPADAAANFEKKVNVRANHANVEGVPFGVLIVEKSVFRRALVVAEGVEAPARQRILKESGVPLAQGFLFTRPDSAGEFTRGYSTSVGGAAVYGRFVKPRADRFGMGFRNGRRGHWLQHGPLRRHRRRTKR
jgi:hypothetical protein